MLQLITKKEEILILDLIILYFIIFKKVLGKKIYAIRLTQRIYKSAREKKKII